MNQKNLLFAGLGLVVVFATGCGPDIAGTCEAQEACLGGNEADIDACIASYEGVRDTAYGIGCGDEFDTFVTCSEPLLECSSQSTGEMCMSNGDCNGGAVCSNGQCMTKAFGVPLTNTDTCEAERNTYSRCNN
ncbi:hypothetical protein [Polyangium mundeleinium]|uniref:Lipoprotein n=1 Tax=Polyangium mundeleinium TaxID=2995306 RepID=A0ABT5EVX4_9BACT|nr:hypothetical protein [Polyangium mundeleinium]MDC0744911.1 hypothetical protein [Polyangium mundeleinium]